MYVFQALLFEGKKGINKFYRLVLIFKKLILHLKMRQRIKIEQFKILKFIIVLQSICHKNALFSKDN